jgi:1,4-dihydroxy-2-naphthoate octaprenyltransferase
MSSATLTTPAPSRAAIWLRALRLYSVTASAVPVLFGIVLAWHLRDGLGALLAIPALLGGVLIHLGTNLINDVGDYKKGVDHEGALGGSGVLVDRLLTSEELSRAAWICFGLAAAIGLGLCAARGLPMLALGSLGILGGWGYTAGPNYKYLGLGDLFVFILMGPLMVLGGALAVDGRVDLAALSSPLYASIPIGLLVTAILHANNLRDLEADQASGLHTVAISLGRQKSLVYFRVLVYGAYAALPVLAVLHVLPWGSLLALISLPIAHKTSAAISAAETIEARRQTPFVEGTAKLHLAFGVLLIVGTSLGLAFLM